MFSDVKPEVRSFIEKQKHEREQRRSERQRERAAVTIQKNWRGYACRRRVHQECCLYVTQFLDSAKSSDDKQFNLQPATILPQIILRLKYNFDANEDRMNFESFCRYLIHSLNSEDKELSYISLVLRRDFLIRWISNTRWILSTVVKYFKIINPSSASDSNFMNILLSLTLILTNSAQWKVITEEKLKTGMTKLTKSLVVHLVSSDLFPALQIMLKKGLALHIPVLTQISLTGIFSLAMRPLLVTDFAPQNLSPFILHILSVPGFVLHINSLTPEAYDVFVRERLCSHVIMYLSESPQNQRLILDGLEGSYALCLIANLIHLSLLEVEVLVEHCEEFCIVVSKLLDRLGGYVGRKKSNLTSWHPILGWFAQPLDNYLQAAVPHVTNQLRLLWHGRMVRLLFADLYEQEDLDGTQNPVATASPISGQSRPAAAAAAKPVSASKVSQKRPARIRPGEQTVTERRSVEGLLPPNPPSFVSRRTAASRFTERLTLRHFLRQLAAAGHSSSLSGGKFKYRNNEGSSLPIYPHQQCRNGLGPEDLPQSIKAVCMLYCFTIGSLKEIRNDILAGLTLGDLLPRMWRLISHAGCVRDWAAVLASPQAGWQLEPHASHLLHLFTAAASNLLIILDDVEVFEKQKAFELEELMAISDFFNHLIYETVLLMPDPSTLLLVDISQKQAASSPSRPNASDSAINGSQSSLTGPTVFAICLRLLGVLYDRDGRRRFTPEGFWLIKELKPSAFLADLRKEKVHATFLLKHVPHIIPRKERVILFRELVRANKASLGILSQTNCMLDSAAVGAVIMIHRNRIVEDGYQQLANLSTTQLRMKIRVQFINAMGLDEVGIDLDGVFKEFLEESLRRVFDPSLNLFRVTTDQRLYPSPTSHIQDGHLQLFEFVGKLLAKAVYEGIIVDVPFANFFLTQILGRQRASCYSFLDELATFDRDLYKSLTYVKHYEGDVSDLELTFSYDEDCLGQIVVHDLVPGGRYITVTNDLKISYVHRVALFRMYKQIRAQTASFVRGFYSIINPDWLAMFSPLELQQLISGDSVLIDLEDLRSAAAYYLRLCLRDLLFFFTSLHPQTIGHTPFSPNQRPSHSDIAFYPSLCCT
uniref:HECT-type E3 ubiquitin transferase n=1 Tax=Schistocephalus solidus TaxID=70667 RepID=A0A0X3PWY0_SCHSO